MRRKNTLGKWMLHQFRQNTSDLMRIIRFPIRAGADIVINHLPMIGRIAGGVAGAAAAGGTTGGIGTALGGAVGSEVGKGIGTAIQDPLKKGEQKVLGFYDKLVNWIDDD